MFGFTTIGTSEAIGDIIFPTAIPYVYEKPAELQFNQNHLFQTVSTRYKAKLSKATINQLHVLDTPDNIQEAIIPAIDIQQLHIFETTDTNYQYQGNIPQFSQEHRITAIPPLYQYTAPAEVDFSQIHVFDGTELTYQNVGRSPFVNPSIVRIVFATDDSTNDLDIESFETSVEVLPSKNKYR